MNIQNKILAFTSATIFLGLLLSIQFQAQNNEERELYQQRPENLIAMVKNLSEKRQKLSLEMSDISDQLYDRRNSFEDETALKKSLEQELNKLEIVNGTRELKGEGLEITFLVTSFVQYSDIISLVNELWASGAEAIAISDIRINSNSDIYFKEGEENIEFTVDGNSVSWPLKIAAIGDSNNLEKGLTLPGGFIDILAYNKIFPSLRQKEELIIPAIKGPIHYQYLKEYVADKASNLK